MFAKHLKHIVIAFGIVLLFLLWYTHAQSQQHKPWLTSGQPPIDLGAPPVPQAPSDA